MRVEIVAGVLLAEGRSFGVGDIPLSWGNLLVKERTLKADGVEEILRQALETRAFVGFARAPAPLPGGLRFGKDGAYLLPPTVANSLAGTFRLLRMAGFDAELRPDPSQVTGDAWVCATSLRRPHRAKDLVYLKAHPVELVETVPPGVEVDLLRGLWSQQRYMARTGCREFFPVGESAWARNGETLIGCYDMTLFSHVRSMARGCVEHSNA